MTEQFILQFVPVRMRQLEYKKYHLRHRDFVVEAKSEIDIPAFNEVFFIIDEPPGLVVESDYGVYDATGSAIQESIHIHRGEIKIINPGNEKRRIKFIQAIIVN